MAVNPSTGQEDPNYVDPNKGIINAQQTPTAQATGIGTTPISAGSVSSQLDTILGTTSPTATPQTQTYTPTLATQDPNKGTVAGQIKGIIDSGSPLMEQAQARSTEAANARGLVNSSMAVQAGQAALYDAALPIASADANTSNKFSMANADITNKAGEFNAQQQNAMIVNGLDNANRIQITELQGKMQKELGGNKTASDLFTSAMSQINNIQQNKDMTPETKQASINQAIAMLEAGLGMAGGIAGLDIGSTLDFSAAYDAGAQALGFQNAADQEAKIAEAVKKGIAKEQASTMTNTAIGAVLGGVTGGLLGYGVGKKIENFGSSIGEATGLWS